MKDFPGLDRSAGWRLGPSQPSSACGPPRCDPGHAALEVLHRWTELSSVIRSQPAVYAVACARGLLAPATPSSQTSLESQQPGSRGLAGALPRSTMKAGGPPAHPSRQRGVQGKAISISKDDRVWLGGRKQVDPQFESELHWPTEPGARCRGTGVCLWSPRDFPGGPPKPDWG